MKYYEETLDMIRQIITHAKAEGVSDLNVKFDHYIPSPKCGYPNIRLKCKIPQNRGEKSA